MQTKPETNRTLIDEIAYRNGFADGARAALEAIPKYLDKGIPLIDAIEILHRWTGRLDHWARETASADLDKESAPPKP
jgi:hypothetical protein